jgi:hypothetical protein
VLDKRSECLLCFSDVDLDGGNGVINAEVTGRTTQIEVNADGTKTMKTGGTKTVNCEFAVVVYFGNITVVWVFFG